MTLDLHPGIAAIALLCLAWLLHRALKPCKCCAHSTTYNAKDFDE